MKWLRRGAAVLVAVGLVMAGLSLSTSSGSVLEASTAVGGRSDDLSIPAAPDDIVVYRTHGPEETADIAASGRYRIPPGAVEGKYVFETERQARELGARFESLGDRPQSISAAKVPRFVVDRAYRVPIGGEGEGLLIGLNDVKFVYDARIIGPVGQG